MTSLREAFGETPGAPWGGGRRAAEEAPPGPGGGGAHYTDPVQPRYADAGGDEAERRYAYERSRQQLYAKSAPQTSSAHPVLSSQEAFQQLLPGGRSQPEPGAVQQAPVSCSTCRGSMSCAGDDVFCRHCNHECLQQRGAGGGSGPGIPHLWQ
jgi:hypothetical protein